MIPQITQRWATFLSDLANFRQVDIETNKQINNPIILKEEPL